MSLPTCASVAAISPSYAPSSVAGKRERYGSGGAYVFEAANEEEADAIVAADPAVIDKVFIAERYPWYLVDWEKRAQGVR